MEKETYYSKNKEECKKRSREYYHNVAKYTIDRKKQRKYFHEYYLKNRDKINERLKRNIEKRRKLSTDERRERHNMSVKRYYEKNKELILEYKRECRQKNPEKVKLWNERVYAKKREITQLKREQRQKEFEELCEVDKIAIYFD